MKHTMRMITTTVLTTVASIGWFGMPATASPAAPAPPAAQAAQAAQATVASGPAQCAAGAVRTVYGKAKRRYVILESYRVEVARGTAYEESVKYSRTVTRTNSVKVSPEVSAKVKTRLFRGAEVKVGGEWGNANTKTTLTKTPRPVKLSVPGRYHVVRALKTFSIPVSHQSCGRVGMHDPNRNWKELSSGKVTGWSGFHGAIRCGSRHRNGIRGYVQAHFC